MSDDLLDYHATTGTAATGLVRCDGCGRRNAAWRIGFGWCPYAQDDVAFLPAAPEASP